MPLERSSNSEIIALTNFRAVDMSRAAMFTVDPTMQYSHRSSVPTVPQNAIPDYHFSALETT